MQARVTVQSWTCSITQAANRQRDIIWPEQRFLISSLCCVAFHVQVRAHVPEIAFGGNAHESTHTQFMQLHALLGCRRVCFTSSVSYRRARPMFVCVLPASPKPLSCVFVCSLWSTSWALMMRRFATPPPTACATFVCSFQASLGPKNQHHACNWTRWL